MPPAQKAAVYVLMQKDMQRRIQVASEKSADAPAAATRSPSEEGIERAETFVQTKLDRRCPISDALYQRDALVSAAIGGEDQILMWATGMGKTMAALGIAILMKGLVTFVLPLATLRDEVFYGRALALLEAAKLAGVRVEWACLDDKIANAADRAAALGVLKGVLTPGGNTYPTIVFVGAEQLQDADVLKIYSQIAKMGRHARAIFDEVHLGITQAIFREAVALMFGILKEQQRLAKDGSVPYPAITAMSGTITESMCALVVKACGMRTPTIITAGGTNRGPTVGLSVVPYKGKNMAQMIAALLELRMLYFDTYHRTKDVHAAALVWVRTAGAWQAGASSGAVALLTSLQRYIHEMWANKRVPLAAATVALQGDVVTGKLLGDRGKRMLIQGAATGDVRLLAATTTLSCGSDISSHTSVSVAFEGLLTFVQQAGRLARAPGAISWGSRAFVYVHRTGFHAAVKQCLICIAAAERKLGNQTAESTEFVLVEATVALHCAALKDYLDSWRFQHTNECRWIWIHTFFQPKVAPPPPCHNCDNCSGADRVWHRTEVDLREVSATTKHINELLRSIPAGASMALEDFDTAMKSEHIVDARAVVDGLVVAGIIVLCLRRQLAWTKFNPNQAKKRTVKSSNQNDVVVSLRTTKSTDKGSSHEKLELKSCTLQVRRSDVAVGIVHVRSGRSNVKTGVFAFKEEDSV